MVGSSGAAHLHVVREKSQSAFCVLDGAVVIASSSSELAALIEGVALGSELGVRGLEGRSEGRFLLLSLYRIRRMALRHGEG